MTKIYGKLDTYIKQIAAHLDKTDNADNKADGIILKTRWAEFVNSQDFVKGKGNTNLRIGVTTVIAEKSLKYYLEQQAATEQAQTDLAEKWFNKLLEVENKPETDNIQTTSELKVNKSDFVARLEENQNQLTQTFSFDHAKYQQKENDFDKKASAKRLCDKWCGIWKSSKLDVSFFEKLLDIIPKLNLVVDKFDEAKFDETKFASRDEQIADRLCLLFAQEASLNPKIKNDNYAGLFQLANDTISSVKMAAKDNEVRKLVPEIQDFKGLSGFAQLNGEQQLDWLIPFCHCKGILNTLKTVDELAAKIKAISINNAKKHGCSTKAERAAQILDLCKKKNNVPDGTLN